MESNALESTTVAGSRASGRRFNLPSPRAENRWRVLPRGTLTRLCNWISRIDQRRSVKLEPSSYLPQFRVNTEKTFDGANDNCSSAEN